MILLSLALLKVLFVNVMPHPICWDIFSSFKGTLNVDALHHVHILKKWFLVWNPSNSTSFLNKHGLIAKPHYTFNCFFVFLYSDSILWVLIGVFTHVKPPELHENNQTTVIRHTVHNMLLFDFQLLRPCCEIKESSKHDHSQKKLCSSHHPRPHLPSDVFTALPCPQVSLVRSGLMSVNQSCVSTVAVAMTTPMVSLAPALPVSKDTSVKSTWTSAKGSLAKMEPCV